MSIKQVVVNYPAFNIFRNSAKSMPFLSTLFSKKSKRSTKTNCEKSAEVSRELS